MNWVRARKNCLECGEEMSIENGWEEALWIAEEWRLNEVIDKETEGFALMSSRHGREAHTFLCPIIQVSGNWVVFQHTEYHTEG